MKISIEQLKETFKYERITEYILDEYHRFDILPDDLSLPKAYMAFSVYENDYFLIQAGFGKWHDHFDSSDDDDKNINDALNFFKNLIDGMFYLIEMVDENGNYKGGAIVDVRSPLSSNMQQSNFFDNKNYRSRKVMFNKPIND